MKPAAPVTAHFISVHPISGSSSFYPKSAGDLAAGTQPRKLKVAVVGGSDVAQRLELVSRMSQDFDLCVLGPDDSAGPNFERVGADYRSYPMTRGVSPWK